MWLQSVKFDFLAGSSLFFNYLIIFLSEVLQTMLKI